LQGWTRHFLKRHEFGCSGKRVTGCVCVEREQFKLEVDFADSSANHNLFALHPEPVEGLNGRLRPHSWLDSSSGSELTTNGNGALLENKRNDSLCHHNRKLH
jgi:hypothetical protein